MKFTTCNTNQVLHDKSFLKSWQTRSEYYVLYTDRNRNTMHLAMYNAHSKIHENLFISLTYETR